MKEVLGAPVHIQRMSSIETEPRTLTGNQLEYVREAALFVFNTKSHEEAISIFTEGLQPSLSAKESMNSNMHGGEVEELHSLDTEHLSQPSRGDVVSAPF